MYAYPRFLTLVYPEDGSRLFLRNVHFVFTDRGENLEPRNTGGREGPKLTAALGSATAQISEDRNRTHRAPAAPTAIGSALHAPPICALSFVYQDSGRRVQYDTQRPERCKATRWQHKPSYQIARRQNPQRNASRPCDENHNVHGGGSSGCSGPLETLRTG